MDTRIGKQLTQAREALGLLVEDVAHRTRIPAASVRHLESEDYSHFPNNVYAKNFLRLYSRFLKVDPEPHIELKKGQLITLAEEVAFLEGIAVSPEFQNLEVSKTPRRVPNSAAKTAVVLVLGIPAAFLISSMFGKGDDKDAKPEKKLEVVAETPASPDEPATPESTPAEGTAPPANPPAIAPPVPVEPGGIAVAPAAISLDDPAIGEGAPTIGTSNPADRSPALPAVEVGGPPDDGVVRSARPVDPNSPPPTEAGGSPDETAPRAVPVSSADDGEPAASIIDRVISESTAAADPALGSPTSQ